jgi:hypothetical protein
MRSGTNLITAFRWEELTKNNDEFPQEIFF